jgi:CRISPR-associated protein (TIGR03984 family)
VAKNEPKWQIEKDLDFTGMTADPRQWFADQGKRRNLSYFLAHADDGVLWGHISDDRLVLSGDAFTEVKVELRAATLQQARLFDLDGELLVWRGDGENEWHGRYLADGQLPQDKILEETHRLWGTASDPPGSRDGFTLMQDGAQGFQHAPPLVLSRDERAVLTVRHYLQEDEQGQAYVALSRLTKITKGRN